MRENEDIWLTSWLNQINEQVSWFGLFTSTLCPTIRRFEKLLEKAGIFVITVNSGILQHLSNFHTPTLLNAFFSGQSETSRYPDTFVLCVPSTSSKSHWFYSDLSGQQKFESTITFKVWHAYLYFIQ